MWTQEQLDDEHIIVSTDSDSQSHPISDNIVSTMVLQIQIVKIDGIS